KACWWRASNCRQPPSGACATRGVSLWPRSGMVVRWWRCGCSEAARPVTHGLSWEGGNPLPSWLLRWLVNTLALLLAAAVLKGVEVDSVLAGIVAAALLGLVNISVRPVL